jgi:predicted nucleotidyltransferase
MKKINLQADFLDFIKLCNEHEVKYLIIGGFAVSIHGFPRYTKDMDICIEMSNENAEKIIMVIEKFGFKSLKLEREDFLKKEFITQLGHEPVRIDIINHLECVTFNEAWNNKKVVKVENVPVNFIGFDELIKVKTNAGRPQDLVDVMKLKKRKQQP